MLASQARQKSNRISSKKHDENFQKIVNGILFSIKITSDSGLKQCQYIAPDNTMQFVTSHEVIKYFKKLGYEISSYPRYRARTFSNSWSKRFGGPKEEYQGLCFTISW